MEKISPLAYRLQLGAEFSRINDVISIAHLVRFVPSKLEFGERPSPTARRMPQLSEEYEVDEIIGHRYKSVSPKRLRRYLTARFKGYDIPEEWPEENFQNSLDLKRKYFASDLFAENEKVARAEIEQRRARDKARASL